MLTREILYATETERDQAFWTLTRFGRLVALEFYDDHEIHVVVRILGLRWVFTLLAAEHFFLGTR